MPKKDVTRRAVEMVTATLEAAITKLGETIPYGPNQVQYTRSELAKIIPRLSGPAALKLAEQLGDPEFVLEAMRKGRSNG